MRIYRPASLQLESVPISISSSADGACLFVLDEKEGAPRLKCFHWASLGETHGIDIDIPSFFMASSSFAISSVGNRNSTHAIFLDPGRHTCSSLSIRITRKSTDFEFSSSDNHVNRTSDRNTLNNTLIDCHSEVWTRFPIQAAIRREHMAVTTPSQRSILFVSSAASEQFSIYFTSMVRDFERKTRKPTRGILASIKILATEEQEIPGDVQEISRFQAGDWFVGLLCLIPIHVAVTGSNRFKPLKDGVISPAFEQLLLGASVSDIADA
jgi:hypothetical protein